MKQSNYVINLRAEKTCNTISSFLYTISYMYIHIIHKYMGKSSEPLNNLVGIEKRFQSARQSDISLLIIKQSTTISCPIKYMKIAEML